MVHNIIILYLLLIQGVLIVNSEPMLLPEVSVTLCPEEDSVKFVCHGIDISAIFWIAEPYIRSSYPIVFPSGEIDENSLPVSLRGSIVARITNLTRHSSDYSIADMESELTVNRNGIANGTMFTCRTYKGVIKFEKSSMLLYPGLPMWKNASCVYEDRKTYVTALLQLGEMFVSNGVPIDHYTITLDDGTQFNTTNNTHGLNIPYNTTVIVNVSAHNCVGYCDPVEVQLMYDVQEQDGYAVKLTTSVLIVTEPSNVPASTKHHISILVVIVYSASATLVLFVIIASIVAFVCVFRQYTRQNVIQETPDYVAPVEKESVMLDEKEPCFFEDNSCYGMVGKSTENNTYDDVNVFQPIYETV